MSEGVKRGPSSGPPPKNPKPLSRQGRRRLAIIAVSFLVLLAGLGGASTRRLQRYITSESAFCLSCHGKVASDLGTRAHSKLDCGSCHRSEFFTGLGLWVAPGRAKSAKHGQIDLGRCKTCHFDQQKDSRTAKSIGHQNHVTAKAHLACNKCHELQKHQTPVNPRSCGACHDKVKVHEHGMNEVACLSCHQFTKEGRAGDPEATGCPTCHSGQPLQPGQAFTSTKTKPITAAVVHGNVNACRLCHEPHRPDPANRRHGGDCASCHQRIVDQNVKANIPTHRNCAECHAVHGPRPKTPDLCVRCHSKEAAKVSEPQLAAHHQGCAGCHKAHTFQPKAAQCIECHKPVQAVLATWNSAPHSNCLNCHSGHTGKDPAAACPTCHVAQRAHGHEKCTVCHEPHKDKSAAKQCANCHQPVFSVISNAKAEQHRVCSSCHATHAAPQAPSRCASCHGQVAGQVSSANVPAHQACISCHSPHQFSATVNACRNCHRAPELGSHRDGCTKCHERHGSPGRPQKSCNGCHKDIGLGRGYHNDCASCHAIHRQPQGGPACVSCHRDKVAAAINWRPLPHQRCDSCHQRHSDKAPKACAECHAEKTSQPLATGHQCLGCHNPHQSPNLTAGLCSNCHKNQASLVRGATQTHSNCIKCHQPHSNQRPTCQGCHQTRAGAHAVKGHQLCSNCHTTHQVQFAGKEKCLSCHKDKVTHYPKATVCTACHAFR